MQPSPDDQEIDLYLAQASAAVAVARELRTRHRKRRRPRREAELTAAMVTLQEAAAHIRRLSGMAYAHDFDLSQASALRRASAELGAERRKIRKMLRARQR